MTAQQLKNSILQMAVQGKLVPQDPNDEPASVLLERIRAEKEQLIKQKKIKKEKNPSYIFRGADNIPYEKIGNSEPVNIANEVPFEIPDSWEWARLGQLVFNRGQCTPQEEFCYIDIGSINNKQQCLNSEETVLSADKAPSRARKLVALGDILYSTVRPYLHNMCMIDRNFSRIPIASTGFAVMTCHGDLYNKYLFYYLMSPDFDAYANDTDNAKGVAYPAINDDRLYRALIPIPPAMEQYRIVAEIESLQGALNEYGIKETELRTLNDTFPEQLKKSILQMAVQGKLVPQDPAEEPASVLLERINAEKQLLIVDGKIKRDKHESIIFRRDNSHYEKLDGVDRCIDDEVPFDIPDEWAWTRLGNLVEIITSGSRDWAKYYSETGSLFLRMGNLSRNSFDLRLNQLQRVHLPEKAEGTRTSLQAGDLLFSITGEVGMMGLIPEGLGTAYINQHTALIRFLPLMRNKYLPYFLLTDYAQKCYKSNQHGIKNSFRLDSISNILVPVPPLAEQIRIVSQVESAVAQIDTL